MGMSEKCRNLSALDVGEANIQSGVQPPHAKLVVYVLCPAASVPGIGKGGEVGRV